MKILYISNLSTNVAAGLNWSVPAGIKEQEKIDEVFWLNMTNVVMPHWRECKSFHNLEDLGGKFDLNILPESFRRPDFVVFEGFYMPDHVKIARILKRENIRYVIVPRGSLTSEAQQLGGWKKKLKKRVANLLFFNEYVKNAAAIQFLTPNEKRTSAKLCTTRSFVLPNGFDCPDVLKEKFSAKGTKAIFIGRLDLFHKGLDLLLEAVCRITGPLRSSGFTLDIYGPERYDYHEIAKYLEEKSLSDIISLKGEISGAEKQRAILDADLFVLTSRFEGHPMGLVEALAYGLPALVTPGSNMMGEIIGADAGWGAELSSESIASALLQVIAQKNLFPAKSGNALKLAAEYRWNVLAQRLHDELSIIL